MKDERLGEEMIEVRREAGGIEGSRERGRNGEREREKVINFLRSRR